MATDRLRFTQGDAAVGGGSEPGRFWGDKGPRGSWEPEGGMGTSPHYISCPVGERAH